MKPQDLVAATGPGRLERGEFVRMYTAGTLSISADLVRDWPQNMPFARPHWSAQTQTIWLEPLAVQDRTAAKLSRERSKHSLLACIGYALNQWGIARIKRQCPAHWEGGWLCIELGRSQELPNRRTARPNGEEKPALPAPTPTPQSRQIPSPLPQTDQSYIAPPPVSPPRPRVIKHRSPVIPLGSRLCFNPKPKTEPPAGHCGICLFHIGDFNKAMGELVTKCRNKASTDNFDHETGDDQTCIYFRPILRESRSDTSPQVAVAGTRRGGNHMKDTPHAQCPECGRDVMIVKGPDGPAYRQHVRAPRQKCPASGRQVIGEK